jgi:hypothetical protein
MGFLTEGRRTNEDAHADLFFFFFLLLLCSRKNEKPRRVEVPEMGNIRSFS